MRDRLVKSRLAKIALCFAVGAAATMSATGFASAQQAGWEKQWADWLSAAKQEGALNVTVPPGPSYREFMNEFSKAYPDIKVSVNGQHIRDAVPRVLREFAAGINSDDIMIGASGVGVFKEWVPRGILGEVKPVLIRPDVLDDANWLCGFNWGFIDNAKTRNFGFLATVVPPLFVNRDAISEKELPNPIKLTDLKDPKWKGKISWSDPREPGSGQFSAVLMFQREGERFLRDLIVEQKPVFTRDERQQVEWAIRNRYPIALGLNTTMIKDFQKSGAGNNVVPIDVGTRLMSPGFGVLTIFAKAQHPNAAKVFANWILTKEGQEAYSRFTGENSRRTDVAAREGVPRPGADACSSVLDLQQEELADARAQTAKVAAEAFEAAR